MNIRIEDALQSSFELHANDIVIVDSEIALTYRKLDEQSNHVAQVLAAAGLQRDDRVCLIIPKSADAIAVVLGILKAGGVYVPLDCSSPAARLSLMVRSCAPCWIVVDSAQMNLADATLKGAQSVPIHGMFHVHAPFAFTTGDPTPADRPRHGAGFDEPILRDLAYILFTSGSTGQPKGVPIQHHSVVEYISCNFSISPGD